MHTVPSQKYIDLSSSRKVPVIASFDVKGDCIPLYFRYNFEDGTYTDISIDRIIKTEKGSSKTAYTCYVTTYDIRRTIKIVYFKEQGFWAINVY